MKYAIIKFSRDKKNPNKNPPREIPDRGKTIALYTINERGARETFISLACATRCYNIIKRHITTRLYLSARVFFFIFFFMQFCRNLNRFYCRVVYLLKAFAISQPPSFLVPAIWKSRRIPKNRHCIPYLKLFTWHKNGNISRGYPVTIATITTSVCLSNYDDDVRGCNKCWIVHGVRTVICTGYIYIYFENVIFRSFKRNFSYLPILFW